MTMIIIIIIIIIIIKCERLPPQPRKPCLLFLAGIWSMSITV